MEQNQTQQEKNEHEDNRHLAHITIDGAPFDIPVGPTLGSTLRNLPSPPVPPERDLWLERPGDDQKILPDAKVPVRDRMVFYTAPGTINPGEECARDALA